MSDKHALWQSKLQTYREREIAAISCHEADAEAQLLECAGGELPPFIAAFFQRWKQTSGDPWQALLQSASTVNSGIIKELISASFVQPLRSFLTRTEYTGILCRPATTWRETPQWSYLLQIQSPHTEESEHIVLYSPATSQEIAAAEAVLRFVLPPGYRHFLMLTNGLGLSSSDTRELTWICSAGPAHANWKAAMLNDWFECEKYNEIASQWRQFQGLYDYEHVMDWEKGENTFNSDETILVPFASTYETWCFDRTRPDTQGEYPVVFWDHERREASDYYSDFSAWFANEVESYFFGEE